MNPAQTIKLLIYVDGLSKRQCPWFASELRKLTIRTNKVQPVRDEESNALMRLADAVAGFVRDTLSGERQDLEVLFRKAIKEGYLREV